MGFPCGSAGKESACIVGDLGSIPGVGRSPGEGNGYSLQYSGLENFKGVAKSQTRLSLRQCPKHTLIYAFILFLPFKCTYWRHWAPLSCIFSTLWVSWITFLWSDLVCSFVLCISHDLEPWSDWGSKFWQKYLIGGGGYSHVECTYQVWVSLWCQHWSLSLVFANLTHNVPLPLFT